MFRMWGKIFKKNRMITDTVICVDNDLNRTRNWKKCAMNLTFLNLSGWNPTNRILSAAAKPDLRETVL